MKHRIFVGAFILVVVALLNGCAAGRDFVRVQHSDVSLGETTYESIKSRMGGEPYNVGFLTKNGKQIKIASFQFADAGGTPRITGVTAGRAQNFYFFKDVLVGHVFMSSFKEDSTWFEDQDVALIKKDETTEAQVHSMFGPPGGYGMYPMTEKEGETAQIYSYFHVSSSGFSVKGMQRQLAVSYDTMGLVTNVEYLESQ